MESIRAFIAIELPADIQAQLDRLMRQIQAQAAEPAQKAVRWVAAGNIHLTLKFLGDIPTANLPALTRALQDAAALHRPFQFTISGAGAFPNLRRPRVFWAGVQTTGELAALQQSIEVETRSLGYPSEERPFSPHLTLGRVNQNARPEEVARVARAVETAPAGEPGQVRVTQVHLFRSDLRQSGSVYTSLVRCPLSGSH